MKINKILILFAVQMLSVISVFAQTNCAYDYIKYKDYDGNFAEVSGYFSFDNDIENVSVTINRTFTSGMTSTIVLPFDIEADG